jgi:hypothetical protein
MAQRFHPRQRKTRTDALVGPGHVFNRNSPRQERSQRDANGYSIGPGLGAIVNSITLTGAGSLGVKSLVSGGVSVAFTIGGGEDLWQPLTTNIASAISGGLSAGFNASSLIGNLVSSGTVPYSLDVTRTILNVNLPPTASYSPGASTAFAWTFPEAAFQNRAGSIAVASALVVTSAA